MSREFHPHPHPHRYTEPLPETVRVVAADALECDWRELVADSMGGDPALLGPVKIVGNIPYAITTPLIEKALESPLPALIVFLVQKDVADRAASGPGSKSYGSLSVGIQVVATIERLFLIRAGSFQPPPRVESAVIRLTPLSEPLIAETGRADLR